MFLHRNFLRTALPAHLYDLKILRVHPDPSLKISLFLFLLLGFCAEHVGVEVVHMLLPGVDQVVPGQIVARQYQRHEGADVFHVVLGQLNSAQRRLRRECDYLLPSSLRIVGNGGHLMELVGYAFADESLREHVLLVGVVQPGFLGSRFGCAEFLDRFVHTQSFLRSGIQQTVSLFAVCLSLHRTMQQRKERESSQQGGKNQFPGPRMRTFRESWFRNGTTGSPPI